MSRNFLCRLLGSVIVGKYPAANYRGVLPRYEERKVLVRGVRDTSRDKLDPITTKLDPLLMRGRYLVTGVDLEKQEELFLFESVPVLSDRTAAQKKSNVSGRVRGLAIETDFANSKRK